MAFLMVGFHIMTMVKPAYATHSCLWSPLEAYVMRVTTQESNNSLYKTFVIGLGATLFIYFYYLPDSFIMMAYTLFVGFT